MAFGHDWQRHVGMDMRREASWRNKLVAAILGLLGIAILGIWALNLSQGFLADGLWTVENNTLAVFHLVAEILMGVAALAGAWGLVASSRWGPPVGAAALGMIVYSTFNSLSHSVRNDPALSPILLVSLILALIGLFALGSAQRPWQGKERSSRR